VGPTSVGEAIWEVHMEWGIFTRWLSSRLACNDPGGRRVRVGGRSRLEVGILVVERNFTKFSGDGARDHFEKCHEPSLRVGHHAEAALEGASAVSSADPGAEDEGVAAVEGDG
jgi:hypothetical protein